MPALVERHSKNHAKIIHPYPSKLREVAMQLPGWRRFVSGELYFELIAGNIEAVQRILPTAAWSEKLQDRLEQLELQLKEAHENRQRKVEDLPPEAFKFPFKTEPYEHQKKAFFLSRDRRMFGLFMEMGTGKTKVLIDTMAYLWSIGAINTVLVVAPNGVHRQWIDEQIPTHMPDWVKHRAFAYKSSLTQRQRDRILDHTDEELSILAMNVEGISSKRAYDYVIRYLLDRKVLMIVDESSKIKNPKSLRTKACTNLGQMALYRRIATGSPITQGVQDLYAQMGFLGQDIIGLKSQYSFLHRYCVMGGYQGREIRGYRNMDDLINRIEPWTFSVEKKDCLDLPEKQYMVVPFELNKEQRKYYDDLKKELTTEIDGAQIETLHVLTQMLRLQQISCGFLPMEDGTVKVLDKRRAEVCAEIMEEVSGKVLVWARFIQDYETLREVLAKYGVLEYHGGIHQNKRPAIINEFRENPEKRVMIINQQAGATGLNLTVAQTAIYYSNTFSAEDRWQSEDRIHRIGQKHTCTYIDLVAERTMDAKILAALKKKQNVAEMLKSNLSVNAVRNLLQES